MNDNARLVLGIWQSISDFVPVNLRDDAAESLVRAFMETEGVELKELYDLTGDCQHLDAAIEVMEDEEEEDCDEDPYGFDELDKD